MRKVIEPGMDQFTLIPHISDIQLKVEAPTLERLFISALDGMNSILNPNYRLELNRHSLVQEFSTSSVDTTALLIDFLSTVLTLSYVHRVIFHTVDLITIEDNALNVHLIGTKVDRFTEDIKAVTYHQAEVITNDRGNYETNIVFDI